MTRRRSVRPPDDGSPRHVGRPATPGSDERSPRAQRPRRRWPGPRSRRADVLLISPTGTGKTLAAFLAILGGLHKRPQEGTLRDGLRCVYVSPLQKPGLRRRAEPDRAAGRDPPGDGPGAIPGPRRGTDGGHVGGRAEEITRQTSSSAHHHAREPVPAAQLAKKWHPTWKGVEHVVVDEIHAIAPGKRGADLMASVERLAARCDRDPSRIGLSATCRPAEVMANFLVGPSRSCRVIEAPPPGGEARTEIAVEALIGRDEAPHRGLTYRRLLKSRRERMNTNRTTVVFANTRALAEKITHDLRRSSDDGPGLDRRSSFGPRCEATSRGRIGPEIGRIAGRRHQHEPGAGRRHRHGRPDRDGRPAGQRLAMPPAGRPVRPSRRRDSAGLILAATTPPRSPARS